MAAIAVKSFIRKARQNAASHRYVINQWDEYREIGHGDNLFVIQHKYIDYVAYIILLRQVEKMQPFQFIFSVHNFVVASNENSIAHVFSLPLFLNLS